MKRQHSGCSPKLWINFFLRSFILDINYRCKINSMLTSIQKIFKISLVPLLPMVKTKFYMCLYSVYISSSFSIFFYYYFKKINYRIRKKNRKKSPVTRFIVTPLLRYVPFKSKTAHPHPRANPGAFDFFEKFWSNSPQCCQFTRSNAPPVRASKWVKSPTLQAC